MLSLGAIAFATPWALAALVGLPLLWWLLRSTPPAPRRVVFPPLRLLLGLADREATAARTPWWLLALRLVLVCLLVLAAAGPVLHPRAPGAGKGPLLVIIDDGWAAAAVWPAVRSALAGALDAAHRDGRPVVLATTAPATGAVAGRLVLKPAAAVREAAEAIEPKPWPTDRPATIAAIRGAVAAGAWRPGEVLWLSDGLTEPAGDAALGALLGELEALAPVTLVRPVGGRGPHLLRRDEAAEAAFAVTVARPAADGDAQLTLRLLADDGTVLGREPVGFAAGAVAARVAPGLPTEWLDRLARVDVEGEPAVGAVLLVDDGWKRRPVGLASDLPAGGERPLIGSFFYVERALAPFAEIRRGPVAELLSRDLAVLVMADVGSLDAGTKPRVEDWVRRGGVLLRFAGPNLLKGGAGPDPLLPVVLRPGDRSLGGTLSWGSAGLLAPFPATGPFAGLSPAADVTISRQVLAEPGLELADRTWARLQDGTPLITGNRLGQGWVVLVHTTANAEWSNLPLSGLFVELLERIVGLGRGTALGAGGPPLRPLETLDGFGRLGAPPPGTAAIAAADWPAAVARAQHPPGYYGDDGQRLALNLASGVTTFRRIEALPSGVAVGTYGSEGERALAPMLLAAVLCLSLLDLIVSLALRGSFGRRPGRAVAKGAAASLLGAALLLPAAGRAAPPAAGDGVVVGDGTAVPASLTTRLAYVRTGDAAVDRLSEAGLIGLSQVVNRRTAADLGPPVGVDPETDQLVFFPLLYWPLADDPPTLSPGAARRIITYMRTGGSILFDARGGAASASLGDLARQLDLPPLVPVGDDHVLRRAYYLLADLPGRWAGRPVWVEPASDTVNDGVSAVIAGSGDWAGAWAVDGNRRPMLAVAPGGERQRELAYRFGVNVVMYVLTGNYKADQVHLPTILERLGP
jgi:hypothetical protein